MKARIGPRSIKLSHAAIWKRDQYEYEINRYKIGMNAGVMDADACSRGARSVRPFCVLVIRGT
jgi:hypothetical protein